MHLCFSVFFVAFISIALAQSVQVRLTLPDLKNPLAPQPPLTFTSGTPSGLLVVVDETITYQPIDGFGASMTGGAAQLIANMDPIVSNNLMKKLFTADGISMSLLRQPIAVSDLSPDPPGLYSYQPTPTSKFSVSMDGPVPALLRAALELNQDIMIMATPWSPPGWMKNSSSMSGGSLLPSFQPALVNYTIEFLQEYAKLGIPIWAVTPQNEPLRSNYPPGMPGTYMEVSQQISLINQLGPAIRAAGFDTTILCYDHNWDQPYYPLAVFNSTAAQYVSGVAWHCYGGVVTAQSTVQIAYPQMKTYLTECSDGTWVSDPWDSTMQLIIGALSNYARGVIRWGIALDPLYEPHLPGGCDDCTGIVTIVNASYWEPMADYWGFAHFSPFLPRGSLRIATAVSAPLMAVGFITPQKTIVLVAYNTANSNSSLVVSWHGTSVSTSLPAMSAMTMTWPV